MVVDVVMAIALAHLRSDSRKRKMISNPVESSVYLGTKSESRMLKKSKTFIQSSQMKAFNAKAGSP